MIDVMPTFFFFLKISVELTYIVRTSIDCVQRHRDSQESGWRHVSLPGPSSVDRHVRTFIWLVAKQLDE